MCLIFSRFLILFFIYVINTGYCQFVFITQKQLGKSYSATSTFKCKGSAAAVLVGYVSYMEATKPVNLINGNFNEDSLNVGLTTISLQTPLGLTQIISEPNHIKSACLDQIYILNS